MIHIEQLSKFYGKKQVLKNLTISFEKGTVYGIVGKNGSGKTTLFRCISGLEKYEGAITSKVDILKNHLGFLMTEPFFFSKMTGREYITMLSNARGKKTTTLEDDTLFNLPLNQYASTYSTGMKKKLALTAILLQGNACFILDEPFNGVDIESNSIIVELIHTLKALGKTVLISSHIFSTLAETCDEIHVLENGVFSRSVGKKDFVALEKEIKNVTTRHRIDALNIR